MLRYIGKRILIAIPTFGDDFSMCFLLMAPLELR